MNAVVMVLFPSILIVATEAANADKRSSRDPCPYSFKIRRLPIRSLRDRFHSLGMRDRTTMTKLTARPTSITPSAFPLALPP
jgi:hypothetical protein